MKVISDERIPIKIWTDSIEESALVQARNLANLPFAFKHIAIMPDVHAGYGMPIGGVLATNQVVIPNAVGVDIGCGMYAQKTNLLKRDLTPELIKKILGGSKEHQGGIRSSIPVGFSRHSKKQEEEWLPQLTEEILEIKLEERDAVVLEQREKSLKQVGTLGGGNHFIEFQYDEDGWVWFMIHSGSRNLGKQVADRYNKLAKEMNERWRSEIPKSWDLAFLPESSKEARAYLAEMEYCVKFAAKNRALMAQRVREAFEAAHPFAFAWGESYNVAHNYARLENHFGKNVIVHRKGATSAREGEDGIIPGSQGSASYLVRGKGNAESFTSCSHGAGRRMSRTKARNELDLEAEIAKLDEQGVIHGIRHQKDLDEAASAYKDISEVIAHQAELVEVKNVLKPLAVVKG